MSKELKRRFLAEAGKDYGFGLSEAALNAQRRREYPALVGAHYLDYTASPPAPISTLQNFTRAVGTTLFANPHSRSASSSATDMQIDLARDEILSMLFGLKSAAGRAAWDVIFTSGATGALRIVAESFPWKGKDGCEPCETSKYRYLKHAHTSLVGVRGCALAARAEVEFVDVDCVEYWSESEGRTLFGYPAASNATGERLGLNLCRAIKRRNLRTMVLLDAAAYVSTSVLDLTSLPLEEAPDFIVCSLYKCFGYPTGLGCLIVKRTSGTILERPAFFGGGTINAMSTIAPFWQHGKHVTIAPGQSSIHQGFEDGTLPFLEIIALRHAFATHTRLYRSHRLVSRHTSSLIQFAIRELSSMRHSNGRQVVKLYRVKEAGQLYESHGSTLGMSFLREDGDFVGHVEFDKLASVNGFHVRTGGLCNAGTLFESMGLTDEDIKRGLVRGRSCGDDEEFDPDTKTPYGMIRVSFGAASTIDDFIAFQKFLKKHYVTSSPSALPHTQIRPKVERVLRAFLCKDVGGDCSNVTATVVSPSTSEKSGMSWSSSVIPELGR